MGETGGTSSESDPHRAVLEDVAASYQGVAAVRRERTVIARPRRSVYRLSLLRTRSGESGEAVRILRSVDMPLDEIRTFLETEDPDLAHKQLVVHRERLAGRLATQERMLAYLESLMKRKDGIMPYDVQSAERESQLVAAIKIRTNVTKIAYDIGISFGLLVHALGREDVPPAGAPLIVYHDVIDEETDGDLEICIPISGSFTGDAEVYARHLEGGTIAATVHHGPYQGTAPAYHTLTGWVSENGHELTGPPREVYLSGPQVVPPEELLTRVEFPI